MSLQVEKLEKNMAKLTRNRKAESAFQDSVKEKLRER